MRNRREALLAMCGAAALAQGAGRSRPVGIFDAPIGSIGNPDSVELAATAGLDGVELHMGRGPGTLALADRGLRAEYKARAWKAGLRIPSVVLGIQNQAQLHSEPVAALWVLDAIEAADDLGARVILLPSFGDDALAWKDRARVERYAAVVRAAGPRAAERGITLGMENRLAANENLELLKMIDADGAKIYYDIANLHNLGHDPAEEIRMIGRERICQVHVKDNPHHLGSGKVDFEPVAQALDDIGYEGWLVLETRIPEPPAEHLPKSREFVRRVFG